MGELMASSLRRSRLMKTVSRLRVCFIKFEKFILNCKTNILYLLSVFGKRLCRQKKISATKSPRRIIQARLAIAATIRVWAAEHWWSSSSRFTAASASWREALVKVAVVLVNSSWVNFQKRVACGSSLIDFFF
jgi:hypothetical protein